MKRFIGAVTVVMACLVMAGGALAFNYTDHVSVAPNGKGDLLVFPVYMATGGEYPYETQFKIVNTSTTHSVVAKVVVRSFAYSKELLDFLIYLSPTDMWIGKLEYGPSGPRMVSQDKSGPVLVPGQNLAAVTCTGTTGDKGVDSNQVGYVEVIEAWSANLGLKSPIEKSKISEAYDKSLTDPTTPYPYTGAMTVDMLSGSYRISVPVLGWEATDNAFAMKSYDNMLYLTSAVETLIGTNARNTVQEVEAGFNKDAIAMTFNNNSVDGGSIHLFTFPTKFSDARNCSRVSTSGSAYFPVNGLVKYGKTVYDNEENSITNVFSPSPTAPDMGDEVMSLAAPTDFSVGWVLYRFARTNTVGATKFGLPLNYAGTPVIPTVVDFVGGDNSGLSIRAGAWTDSAVTGEFPAAVGFDVAAATATSVIRAYQYSSEFVTSTN